MGTACAALFAALWVFLLFFSLFQLFKIPYLGFLLFNACCWGVFSFVEDVWHVASLRAAKRRRAHHFSGKKEQQRAAVAWHSVSFLGGRRGGRDGMILGTPAPRRWATRRRSASR